MESPEVYESESDEESAVEEEEKGEENGNVDSAIEVEEVASGSENEESDTEEDEDEDDSGAENSGSEEQSGMGLPFPVLVMDVNFGARLRDSVPKSDNSRTIVSTFLTIPFCPFSCPAL